LVRAVARTVVVLLAKLTKIKLELEKTRKKQEKFRITWHSVG
jgi:hypothetical protein